jgi:thiol-disulfide isomerase/thioredoxin
MVVGVSLMLSGCDKQDKAKGQVSSAEKDKDLKDVMAKTVIGADRKYAGKVHIGSFTGPSGKTVSIKDFIGKPLVLNLWATWCSPCKAEMPQLDILAGQGLESGKFDLIVVSQDSEGAKMVDPYFATSKFKHLQPYLDPELTLTDLFSGTDGSALPLTVLIDAKGREVLRFTGPLDWTGKKAAALVDEMVKAAP